MAGARALCVACAAWAALACAGCAASLGDLQGDRSGVALVKPAPADAAAPGGGAVQEVPTTFRLRNGGWGSVRVESMRVPISTDVETDPRLPATVKSGDFLTVKVTSKLRPDAPLAARNIYLETKGQAPLQLVVQPERAK